MRRTLLLTLLAFSLLPAAAQGATVTESYRVPTVDGAQVYVEVTRDPRGEGAGDPHLLALQRRSARGRRRRTRYGKRYVPRGYARAVADVIGTRNSSGCWDYGGAKEQQSGVDLVNFLAGSRGRTARSR